VKYSPKQQLKKKNYVVKSFFLLVVKYHFQIHSSCILAFMLKFMLIPRNVDDRQMLKDLAFSDKFSRVHIDSNE